MELTQEQKDEFNERTKKIDEKIKKILEENELGIKALPVFLETKNGLCVASAITQYYDLKYNKKPTIEVEEKND